MKTQKVVFNCTPLQPWPTVMANKILSIIEAQLNSGFKVQCAKSKENDMELNKTDAGFFYFGSYVPKTNKNVFTYYIIPHKKQLW